MGLFFEDAFRASASYLDEATRRRAAAAPSFERTGLTHPHFGPGVADFEGGHQLTAVAPNGQPGDTGWKAVIHHAANEPDTARTVHLHVGHGDEDAGERIMAALRHPQVLRAMQEQMRPGPEDGWPRRFYFY